MRSRSQSCSMTKTGVNKLKRSWSIEHSADQYFGCDTKRRRMESICHRTMPKDIELPNVEPQAPAVLLDEPTFQTAWVQAPDGSPQLLLLPMPLLFKNVLLPLPNSRDVACQTDQHISQFVDHHGKVKTEN